MRTLQKSLPWRSECSKSYSLALISPKSVGLSDLSVMRAFFPMFQFSSRSINLLKVTFTCQVTQSGKKSKLTPTQGWQRWHWNLTSLHKLGLPLLQSNLARICKDVHRASDSAFLARKRRRVSYYKHIIPPIWQPWFCDLCMHDERTQKVISEIDGIMVH